MVGQHDGTCGVAPQLDAVLHRDRSEELDHLADDGVHPHRLEGQRQGAGFDSGQVERLVDQLEQVGSAGGDTAQCLVAACRVHRQRAQQSSEAGDGLQRRAHLVAHRRQESRLGPAGGFGGAPCHHGLATSPAFLLRGEPLGDVEHVDVELHRFAPCAAHERHRH